MRRSMSFRRPWPLALVILLVVNCDIPQPPPYTPVIDRVVALSGLNQSGTVGAQLGAELAVRVLDQEGRDMKEVSVAWSVTAGGGTVNPPNSVTDESGVARTRWTLGPKAGAGLHTVKAAAGTIDTTFAATATADVPFKITPGTRLVTLDAIGATTPLTATVVDKYDNVITPAIAWQSAKPDTVSVSGSVATAVKAGTALLTATAGAASDTMRVTVTPIPTKFAFLPGKTAAIGAIGSSRKIKVIPQDRNSNAVVGAAVAMSNFDTSVVSLAKLAGDTAHIVVTCTNPGGCAGAAARTAKVEVVSGSAKDTIVVNVAQALASISVLPVTATVETGGTLALAAVPKDSNGFTLIPFPTITWESSATGVATVSGTGLVTGVAQGSTSISARAAGPSGTITGSKTISVVLAVGSVAISPVKVLQFGVPGRTRQLSAVVKDPNGTVITSSATTTWTSEDPATAFVTSNGLVTAMKVGGPIRVIATSGSKADTALVTVSHLVTQVSMSFSTTFINAIGFTRQLTATPIDSSSQTVPNVTATWSSADSSKVTVTNGLVTAVAPTVTAVNVSATVNGVVGSTAVTVRQIPKTFVPTPTGQIIEVGQNLTLASGAVDSADVAIPASAFTWTSNTTSVATVDATAKVTAVTPGSATITATLKAATSITATANVTVVFAIGSVTIGPVDAVTFGALAKTRQMTATVRDPQNNVIGAGVTWASDSVATVSVSSNGLLTAVKVGGPVRIIATSGAKADTALVTVTQVPFAIIGASVDTINALSFTRQLSATVTDSNGAVMSTPITWATTDATKITSTTGGFIAAVQTTPTFVAINATASGLTKTVNVHVRQLPKTIAVQAALNPLFLGQTTQYTITATDSASFSIPTSLFTYASAIPSVATVDATGLVRGVGAGTSSITVTFTPKAGFTGAATATVSGLPNGVTKVWLGTGSSSWSTPGNWGPSGVPVPSDTVRVMPGGTQLGNTGGATIARIIIDPGATVASSGLTVTKSAEVLGTLTGSLFMAGPATSVRGTIGALSITSGTATLTGPVTTATATISGAGSILALGGQKMTVTGAFTAVSSGLLQMTNPLDTLDVRGSATFSGGDERGFLTAGRMLLGGSLTGTTAGSFAPRSTFRLTINGTTRQTITLDSANVDAGVLRNVEVLNATRGASGGTAFASAAGFNQMTLDNFIVGPSTGALYFATQNRTITNSVSFADSVVVSSATLIFSGDVTVTGPHDGTVPGFYGAGNVLLWGTLNTAVGSNITNNSFDLSGTGGTIGVLGGFSPNQVAVGNSAQVLKPGLAYKSVSIGGGGSVLIQPGSTTFAGNLFANGGSLVMQSALDTVIVTGNATFSGPDTRATLAAGVLRIGGDLTATTAFAFAPQAGLSIVLDGNTRQEVRVDSLSADVGGVLRNLTIRNPTRGPGGGVRFMNHGSNRPVRLANFALDTTVAALVSFDARAYSFTDDIVVPDEMTVASGSSLTFNNAVVIVEKGSRPSTPGLTGAGTITIAGQLRARTGSAVTVSSLSLSHALGTDSVFGSFSPALLTLTGVNQGLRPGHAYQAISITGSVLTRPGTTLATGQFWVTTTGTITMTDPAVVLDLRGAVIFEGPDIRNKLTAGTLKVGGDFTSITRLSFVPRNTFATVFDGSARQLVAVDSQAVDIGGVFRNVTVNNPSHGVSGGVYFANAGSNRPIRLDNFAISATSGTLGFNQHDFTVANSIAVPDSLFVLAQCCSGTTLKVLGDVTVAAKTGAPVPGIYGGSPLTITGDLHTGASSSVTIGSLDLAGALGTSDVQGSFSPGTLILRGTNQVLKAGLAYQSVSVIGSVVLQPGTARLTSSLTINNGASIAMTDALDTLDVRGAASFSGVDTRALLTAGVMRFGGNLSASQPFSFATGAGISVLLDGTGSQSIGLDSATLDDGGLLRNVKVLNHASAAGGVTFTGAGNIRPVRFANFQTDSLVTGRLVFQSHAFTIENSIAIGDSLFVFSSLRVLGDLVVANQRPPLDEADPPFSVPGLQSGTIVITGDLKTASATSVNVGDLSVGGSLGTTAVLGAFSVPTLRFTGVDQPIKPTLSYQNVSIIGSAVAQTGLTTVTGTLNVSNGTGLLKMNNAAATIRVIGNAAFEGADSRGQLTAGTLRFGGYMAATSSTTPVFAPRTDLQVVFDGTVYQGISFRASAVDDGGIIRNVTVRNATRGSSGGVHFANVAQDTVRLDNFVVDTTAAGLIELTAGPWVVMNGFAIGDTLRIANGVRVAGDVTVAAKGSRPATPTLTSTCCEQLTIQGDLRARTGSSVTLSKLALMGSLGTDSVFGAFAPADLILAGTDQPLKPGLSYQNVQVTGSVVPGAGLSSIAGSLNVSGSGLVKMAAAAETLRVVGNATFNGADSRGHLTAGALRVGGTLSAGTANAGSFAPRGTFQTILDGASQQTGSFAYGAVDDGGVLRNLTIRNPSRGSSGGVFLSWSNGGDTLRLENFAVDTTAAGVLHFGGSHWVVNNGFAIGDSLYVDVPFMRVDGDVVVVAKGSRPATPGLHGQACCGNHILSITGDLRTRTGSSVTVSELQLASALGTDSVFGSFAPPQLVLIGTGQVLKAGPTYQSVEVRGTAVAGPGASTIAGILWVNNNGRLVFNDAAASLRVTGSATFSGADTRGYLTAGTLRLASDFTATLTPNGFAPSGSFQIVADGTVRQHLAFAKASVDDNGVLRNLTIRNATRGSDGGVYISHSDSDTLRLDNFVVDTTAAGAIQLSGSPFVILNSFAVADSLHVRHYVRTEGDLIVAAKGTRPSTPGIFGTGCCNTNQLYITGNLVTRTASNVTIDNLYLYGGLGTDSVFGSFGPVALTMAGTSQGLRAGLSYQSVAINGTATMRTGTTTFAGSLNVNTGARLSITDAGVSLRVNSVAVFAGADTRGHLTAGTLRLGGDLHATTPNAFAPRDAFQVVFDGTANQGTNFTAANLDDGGVLRNLTIRNATRGSGGAVWLNNNSSDTLFLENFVVDTTAAGVLRFTSNSFVVTNGFAVADSMHVDAFVRVQGDLTVAAKGSRPSTPGIHSLGCCGSKTLVVTGDLRARTGTSTTINLLRLAGGLGTDSVSGAFAPSVLVLSGTDQPLRASLNYQTVTVTGTAIARAGTTSIAGSFDVNAGARFSMADVNANLRVLGTATFAGTDTRGYLTAGTLRFAGHLNAYQTANGFAPTNSLQVVFDGTAYQSVTMVASAVDDGGVLRNVTVRNSTRGNSGGVYFGNNNADTLRFENFAVDTTAAGVIRFTNSPFIVGNGFAVGDSLYSTTYLGVMGDLTLAAKGSRPATPSINGVCCGTNKLVLAGDLRARTGSSVTIDNLTLAGALGTDSVFGAFAPTTLTLSGTDRPLRAGLSYQNITLAGTAFPRAGTTTMTGSLTVGAGTRFSMTDAGVEFRVLGVANFAGSDTRGYLTAGTLRLAGDLNAYQTTNGFAPSGAIQVILDGTARQDASFTAASVDDGGVLRNLTIRNATRGSSGGVRLFINTSDTLRFTNFAVDTTAAGVIRFGSNAPAVVTNGFAIGDSLLISEFLRVEGNLTVAAKGTRPATPGIHTICCSTSRVVVSGDLRARTASSITINELYLGGALGTDSVFGAFSPITLRLTGSDQPIKAGLSYQNVTITGSAVARSGTTSLAGGITVSTGARFSMTEATADFRVVGGATFAGADTRGYLSAGTLRLGGDVSAYQTANGFAPTGTIAIVFDGTGRQNLTFAASAVDDGGVLRNVTIRNGTRGSSGGVYISGNTSDTLRLDNFSVDTTAAGVLAFYVNTPFVIGNGFAIGDSLHSPNYVRVAGDITVAAKGSRPGTPGLYGGGTVAIAGNLRARTGTSITVDVLRLAGAIGTDSVLGAFTSQTLVLTGTNQALKAGLGYKFVAIAAGATVVGASGTTEITSTLSIDGTLTVPAGATWTAQSISISVGGVLNNLLGGDIVYTNAFSNNGTINGTSPHT